MRALRGAASSAPLPVGTVTFLLADIEGSVRLWESDRSSMTSALARLDVLVEQTTSRHHGARPVEQGEGDSFVAVFVSAEDAVACALDLQRAMAEEPWPGGIALRSRLALHTGDAQLRDEGNYIGTTISRCGRLRSLAHGGQTLLSPTTYELVADTLPDDASLRDLGLQRVRDVPRPMRVYQLCHPELDATFPALRSLEVLTQHLPQQLTTFIGRETELADIEALLADRRLVTLTGAGGCGKTRLALRAAEHVADRHPDGLWFVDLSLVRDDTHIAQAVAAAVGARRPLLDTVLDVLRTRRAMLVLDNCEHVVTGCADLVDTLLRECPGLTVLATSREPLRVEGESTWRVPSMTTPGVDSTAALDTYDAVRLFIDRAVRARPNFTVTNASAPAVASICQQLDGIPLGIELAAARVRLLTPDQIATGLSDRFHLLRGGARGTLERQQTLSASVDWSHDLLDDAERMLLRRLSVFVGGFTLDAAEQVTGGDGIEGIDVVDVLDLLAGLVDKSLVVTGDDDGPDGRYRLLETIRQYAAARADAAGETELVRERHAAFFVRFVREAEPEITGADQLAWLSRLDADLDNLRAAIDWAITTERGKLGLQVANPLGMYCNIRGHWYEAIRWFDKLIPIATDASPVMLGMAMFLQAGFQAMTGNVDDALPVMESLVEAAQAVGDDLMTAWCFNQLGKYTAVRDVRRGRDFLEEGANAARRSGDPAIITDTLTYAAWLELSLGRTDAAAALLNEANRTSRAVGDVRGLVIAMPPRVSTAIRRADYGLAHSILDEGMELADALGDPFTLALAFLLSGEVAMAQGRYGQARELIEEGVIRGKNTGGPFLAAADGYIARLLFHEGDAESACALWARTAPGLDPVSSWLFTMQHPSAGPGEWLLALGRLDEARDVIASMLSTADESGHVMAAAHTRLARARLCRLEGDGAAAEADCHRALATFLEASAPVDVATALEALGWLAADAESWHESARLLGAVAAVRSTLGAVAHAFDRATHDEVVAQLTDALGADALDAALADGAAMTLDQAVAYAARGRGERKRPTSGWESLTPTELDVVALVAGGATNRQVGEQLFIAANTVKVHLSHVFAKLGVSSRAELAAIATQRGLAAESKERS